MFSAVLRIVEYMSDRLTLFINPIVVRNGFEFSMNPAFEVDAESGGSEEMENLSQAYRYS